MKIRVKEIFGPTIEGEGSFSGEKAHFIRLSGCNIWDGRAETKAKSMCPYCDTDFVGGEEMTVNEIVDAVEDRGMSDQIGLVNLTGGEPLLQDIAPLCKALTESGYMVNIETNGTKRPSDELRELDNVFFTCSPKVPEKAMKLPSVDIDCLKVLYPHPSGRIHPEDFDHYNTAKYIQPIETDGEFNFQECMDKLYELDRDWSLSVQIHKWMGAE